MNPRRRRLTRSLRREARDMLLGGPPTIELMRPIGPEVPSDRLVVAVLDLCLQVGDALLVSGEAAADTTAAMTRLAAAFGLSTVEIDITFTSITVCCRRGRAVAPVTSMRVVRYRTTDLTRLTAVTRIVDDIVSGTMSLPAADAALAEAVEAAHPYPRWVATVAWAGVAAAVALLLGGGPAIWLTAFLVSAVVDRLGRFLAGRGVVAFFLQLGGGLTATASTLGLLGLGVLPPAVEPSLVIAVSITVLLSGLSLVNAVQDAISGHPVTAAGRSIEVGLLSAGLLAGVIIGLELGAGLGLTLDPAEPVAANLARFWISALAAAVAALLYALACYAPLRSLVFAALAGGAGWAAYGVLTRVELGPVVATGLAAVVIGAASEVTARTTRTDRHVLALAGIVPLLPGLTAYRGFYQLATGQETTQGLVTVTLALAIGLALAAGVTAGRFLARFRPTVRRRGRMELSG